MYKKKYLINAKSSDIIIKLSKKTAYTVGVDCGEGPPVPIPNTEVKLISVKDTWLVTTWENRTMPTQRTEGS